MQRNWIGPSDGASIDFPRGRVGWRADRGVHHPARHAVRRHLHGAGARAPAGRRAGRRRVAGRHPAGWRYPEAAGPRPTAGRRPCLPGRGQRGSATGSGQETNEKTGVFTGSLRDQPGDRRAGAGVHRRLRADGLRHRRDHGGARPRPARLGVRPAGSACRSGRSSAACRTGSPDAAWHRQPPRDMAGGVRRRRRLPRPGRARARLCRAGKEAAIAAAIGWLERHGAGQRHGPTGCATGCSPGSATGASRSRSSTTSTGCPRAARGTAAGGAARDDGLPATSRAGRRRATRCRRWPAPPDWVSVELDLGDGPQAVPPRDSTPCRSGPAPAGTTCATWTRPTTTRLSTRRSSGTGWARRPQHARRRRRRPVRRRRRARGAAPAVRPVLAQGAVRPGLRVDQGAVPAAVQPGLHPGRRLPRRARHVRAGRRGGRGSATAGRSYQGSR